MYDQSKFIVVIFKYLFPVIVVIQVCATVYDRVHPWPPATEALSEYPNSQRFVYAYKWSGDYFSKSYLLVNFHDLSSNILQIRKGPFDRKFRIHKSEGGLLQMVLFWLIAGILTTYVWKKSAPDSSVRNPDADAAQKRRLS